MDIDRRKSAKAKRHELGLRLTIDWCFLIFLILHITYIDAIAFQNVTNNRDNNVDIGKADVKNILHKSKSDGFKSASFHSVGNMIYNYNLTKIGHQTNMTSEQNLNTAKSEFTNNDNGEVTLEYNSTSFEDTTTEVTTQSLMEILTESTIVSEVTEESTTETIATEIFETEQTTLLIDQITTLSFDHETTTDQIMNLKDYTQQSITEETTVEHTSISATLNTSEILNATEINLNINENIQNDKEIHIDKDNKTQSTVFENAQNVSNKVELKNGSKIDFIESRDKGRMQNTTGDDYNISYEIDDYDEDVMKKMAEDSSTAKPPSPGPFDMIRNFASDLIESLYERYIPKSFRDIWNRMQEQNDKLETIRLRSKEENGGIGQFGRSILKGLYVPFNQLMQGVRDYGSLDSDRNFFSGAASGVVSIADSVSDLFKDRVRAIYPGTLWCGDGDMARSAEVGLFFMTDSCCRQHDSCHYYIEAGATKYGLTNTGIFTRSHCECDKAFYRCLKKTNSLVSTQIGLTYFSILGPQCFKREHPIIKCKRRTRITGQKCEEYSLDYSQPKMWQWFDSETF